MKILLSGDQSNFTLLSSPTQSKKVFFKCKIVKSDEKYKLIYLICSCYFLANLQQLEVSTKICYVYVRLSLCVHRLNSQHITDIHYSYGRRYACWVGKVWRKRRLLRRLSSHLSSLAMQVVIQGGTKQRHIRSHKGLQGLTCIEMLIKCRLVIWI